jgi:RNA polymerase sigma factor (sigma-70 family)
VVEQLQQCLANFEFDRAFIDVLGWSKFRHVSRIELPDIGRMPRGWKTRKTRARIEAAARIPFIVRGIATLAPQVVLHCSSESGKYIDDLQRERLSRELAKLFYRPIIIFASVELRCQDWYFPIRNDDGMTIVKFSADGRAGTERLAEALSGLELTVENLYVLDDHLEVFRRVSAVREELHDEPERDDEMRFALKFANFGDRAFEDAKKAFRARVWEVPRQIEIGRRAKAGDPDAIQRFFDMHLYLVFERAREYLKNKHAFISEFEDYVGAGNLGVARGFARYDPTKPYAPSTLIFFHIDKQISRSFGLLELPMWVPVHVQSDLLQACWRERTAFDVLAQYHRRTPTDSEVLESLGLEEEDIEVYGRFKLSRLWENRICWEELDDDDLEDNLTYCEAFDRREDLKKLEAYVRLDALPKRHQEALSLRVGLHKAAQGDQLTLEEVGEVMEVTRERVRQLLIRAPVKAMNAEIAPIDPAFPKPDERLEPKSRTAKHKSASLSLKPTHCFESANQYIDILLTEIGLEADPQKVHRAMKSIFPHSSLKVERIVRKLEVMRQAELESEEVLAVENPTNEIWNSNEPHLFIEPIQLALVEMEDSEESDNPNPPPPPWNIRKANAYVEHLLNTYGSLYCPVSLMRAVRRHFPHSIITETQIQDKFRRRGWAK